MAKGLHLDGKLEEQINFISHAIGQSATGLMLFVLSKGAESLINQLPRIEEELKQNIDLYDAFKFATKVHNDVKKGISWEDSFKKNYLRYAKLINKKK